MYMKKRVSKIRQGLKGAITIPADKSISHRAVMLTSLAKGKSLIKNFSQGKDPHSTLNILKQLGVHAEFIDDKSLTVESSGSLNPPAENLDCGNSGTAMRLMSGILAGQNFTSTLAGDSSLSKRPMNRIIKPLELMGADIKSDDGYAPIVITGKRLHGINYASKLASAQVKSCILLAGLNAEGLTSFSEPYLSRNHTELMLKYMGAELHINAAGVSITKSILLPRTIEICGDISSAAFFIAAGITVPNSDIILRNVGLNPTRTGILDAVKLMGANIEILDKHTVSGEETGDVRIKTSDLKACQISGEIIPRLIDELPIIAVLATQAEGETIIKNAEDLRNKETDRITATAAELKKLGADIEELDDGFIIRGKTKLTGGCEVETYRDHRLAMSLYTAGLICEKEIAVNEFEWVKISFPEFEQLFNDLM